MGRPRIDSKRQNHYIGLRQQGWSIKRAAVEAKVSESWAKGFERKLRNSSGGAWREAREEKSLKGPIPVDELKDEARRALEDFEYFRRRYFGHVSTPWQVEAANLAVELLESPHKEFVVVNCPPGVGKTTLFTHDIPAWLTVRNRSIRGIIGSRTFRQAEMHCARLRRSFERVIPVHAKDDERNRGLALDAEATLSVDFGRFKPMTEEVWKRDQFTVAQFGEVSIDEKESTWTAFGMDSGSLGWRVNYITWDDVVDKTTIRTAEATDKQREWWDDEAETRLEPGGVLVLPGQRMAANDLYHYCLDKRVGDPDDDEAPGPDAARKYRHIVYKAHYDETCESVHRPDVAEPYPGGCLLDPVRLPWRELRALQANNAKFRTVYQQEDVDPSAVLVPPVWVDGGIDPIDGSLCPGCWDADRDLCELPEGLVGPKFSIATVDPSPTKMWAVQWWVHTPEAANQTFLMDLERKAMPANDLLDWNANAKAFYGLMEDWQVRSVELGLKITHWVIEVNAAQRFLLAYDHVRRWTAHHGVSIVPHSTTMKKLDPELGPWIIRDHFRHGRVRLPGAQHTPARIRSMKLRDEVTRWPEAATDDEVMACWFLFAHLPNLARPRPDAYHQRRPSWMRPLRRSA